MNDPNPTTYIPAPDILFTEVDEEMVLFDPNRGLRDGVYVLDDIGARIWQLIVEYGNKSQVANRLLREYDVDEVTVNAALDDLITQLLEQGFLSTVLNKVDL